MFQCSNTYSRCLFHCYKTSICVLCFTVPVHIHAIYSTVVGHIQGLSFNVPEHVRILCFVPMHVHCLCLTVPVRIRICFTIPVHTDCLCSIVLVNIHLICSIVPVHVCLLFFQYSNTFASSVPLLQYTTCYVIVHYFRTHLHHVFHCPSACSCHVFHCSSTHSRYALHCSGTQTCSNVPVHTFTLYVPLF